MKTKLNIGLFSIGLAAYWPQFNGLRERLAGYGAHVAHRLAGMGADVLDAGMVDDQPSAARAGEIFSRGDVDLVVCFVTTYATASQVVPAVQRLGRPVLLLDLQPTARLDYARTGTGEWLANCQACCVPEIACAFERCGIEFHTVTGLLGLEARTPGALADEATAAHPAAIAAWGDVREWLEAAAAIKAIRSSRIGFLGHTYPGMLDMYSDFTQVTGELGSHIELLEMDDLAERVRAVTESETLAKLGEVNALFDISEDSPSDPLARRPHPDDLDWACRVASGLDRLASDFALSGLAYYYRGAGGNENERLIAGAIVGCSLLTSRGIPCSGEGDLKNCVAMKIMDELDAGGSFTELYAMDFAERFLLMGHDGPFHPRISEGRPILRGLSLYHGKSGSGVSVEAQARTGPVTILGLTQRRDGRLKLLGAEGWSLPGERLRIGNTNSRIRLTRAEGDEFDVARWMNAWAAEGPTHHVALGVGHRLGAIRKLAALLDIPFAAMD